MANLRTNNLSGEQGQNAYRGSVFFDGESHLTTSHTTDFDFNADNFTIEYWFFESDRNRSERRVLYLYDSNQSFIVGHTNDNGGQIFFSAHDSSNNLISGSIVTTSSNSVSDNDMNQWMHVAIVRDGSNLKIYLNGILEATDTGYSTTALRSDQNTLYIGTDPVTSGRQFKGYISNLRLTKGLARYTSTFTPPAFELTADADTVLLCCQNSDDVTQEETGKTITGFGNLQESDNTELVTNSGFTADISGWTASGVQWSHSSGALMHFGNGNTQRNIYQDVTTVIGKRYVFRVEASSAEADTAYWQVIGSSDLAGNNFIADNNNAAPIEHVFYFTADSTTTKIRFYSYDSSNSSNVRSYWYKASLQLAPQGKQPKVIPPYGVDAGNTFGGPIQQSSQGYMYFPTGRTEERGGGRAVFGGGANPSITSVIDYVHVPTDGNAIKFGDLSGQTNSIMAVSSQTRGIWGGGNPGPGATNAMEFVTLATTSNTTDFGDLTVARMHGGAVQNSTRGVFMTGYTPSNVNTIDFITMASTGDATDFGDVIDDGWPCGGGRSSSTRGVLMGHGDGTNRIQFITIMTTGNSQDFGDLNTNSYGVGAGELSDGLRGIAMGGSGNPGDHTNVIDFITIATTGNATEFGDLTVSRRGGGVGCTLIKGICAGGRNPSDVNIIDSVIIQTTGNATDFGDISEARAFQPAGCSDSHGGLS